MRAEESEVRLLAKPREFSFIQGVQTGSGVHPASYSMWTGVLCGG